MENRLLETLRATGCPVTGVRNVNPANPAGVTFDVPPGTPQNLIDAATAALRSFDWSQGAQDAWLAQQQTTLVTTTRGVAAVTLDTGTRDLDLIVRALTLMTLDQIVQHAQWVNAFRAAVAAASSLADLKTRVANIPGGALPEPTKAQLIAALKAKLSSGAADPEV